MSNVVLILFLIILVGMPAYYLTVLYSIYYKKIFKNKANLKFEYTTSSLSTYIPSIILLIVSALFAIAILGIITTIKLNKNLRVIKH